MPFDQNDQFQSKFATPQDDQQIRDGIDIESELKIAIETPVLYPPLEQSVFAGDKVAIVVQPGLPHPRSVLHALINALAEMNVSAEDISVVVNEKTARELELDAAVYRLPDETKSDQPPPVFDVEFGFHQVRFQVHDAENQSGLAYLAANMDGEPVYVNRILVDADFVLTLGSPLPGDATRAVDCIYPAFSGLAAQERFASDAYPFNRKQAEIELANDMLGSFFVAQLVCGPGEVPTEFVAGVRKQATDQARLATNENWEFRYDEDADTVVATIESESSGQDWDSFAEAVVFANQFVVGAGPIVVWSELDQKPSSFAKRACNDQFESVETTSKLPTKFQQLAGIVAERPIFLRSRLGRNTTEGLGLGYLESVEEVVKIAEPFERGLLIRDAHRCQR
ncbi:MAG: lactate racemase domain-containing protein [Planctomycetota bacterium]